MVRARSLRESSPTSGPRRRRWPRARAALGGALALATAACGVEVDPEEIEASAIASGRFELVSGRPVFAESTTRIPCAPDALFGVDYRIEVPGLRLGGVLPIESRWRHPEFAIPSEKLWGSESPAGRPDPVLEWGESSLVGRALWSLSHPDERKDGRWEFVIRAREGGRVLLSRSFDVEGC